MPGSILTAAGIAHSPAGAALGVFSETIRRDTELANFHGGSVHLPHQWKDLKYPATRVCMCYGSGIEVEDDLVGSSNQPVMLTAEFAWKENSTYHNIADATALDLEWWWRVAVLNNQSLVWDNTWTAPPATSAITSNATHARSLVRLGASAYAELLDEEGGACYFVLALSAVYLLNIDLC